MLHVCCAVQLCIVGPNVLNLAYVTTLDTRRQKHEIFRIAIGINKVIIYVLESSFSGMIFRVG